MNLGIDPIRKLLLCLFSVLLTSSVLLAEQRELKGAESEAIDAVLLLDSSGSMLVTDPSRLRDDGAKLFIQSLREKDRLAIVQFSGEAKVIRPLSPYKKEQADTISTAISNIQNSGIYTDIFAAIEQAKTLLEANPRDDARQVVILLSDGKMDPDPKVGSAEVRARELLDSLILDLRANEINVYTLYFSEQADKELLSQIATSTDGLNWFTPSSDKIHESYTDLFLAVKKPQIVPLTSKGFSIDDNIQEATFYINREDGADISMRSPAGQQINPKGGADNVKWFRTKKFDVITVLNPEPGDWSVQGISSNEGFATVLTNLKLTSDWQSGIYSGNKTLLQARLYESDKPVVLPEMTGAATYAYQVTPTDRVSEPIIREFLVDDGSKGDRIANDGIFSSFVEIDEIGSYRLDILLKAPTFERRLKIPFRVKPRLATLRFIEEERVTQVDPLPVKQKVKLFELELSPEVKEYGNLDVKIMATDEDRAAIKLKHKKSLKTSKAARDGLLYEAYATLPDKQGTYKVQAYITGVGRRDKLREESNALEYEHKPEEAETHTVVDIVDFDPDKEPEAPPVWPHVLFIIILNLGVGGFLFNKLQGLQSETSDNLPEFEPKTEIIAAVQALRAKSALTEIALDDPIFNQDLPAAAPHEAAEPAADVESASNAEAATAEDAEETSSDEEAAPDVEAPAAEEEQAAEEPAEEEQAEAEAEEADEEEKKEE